MAVTKELAGKQDLLLGQGTENQSRGGNTVAMVKINADTIPYIGEEGDVGYKSIKTALDEADPAQVVQNAADIATNAEDIITNSEDIIINANNIDANTQAIANLASAQGAIVNTNTPAIAAISLTPTLLEFDTTVASTDGAILILDDTTETITLKQNISYNFYSTVTFTSATSQAAIISFNLVDDSDNTVIQTQQAPIDIANGKSSSYTLNTLITVGSNGIPTAPLTIRVEAVADNLGYALHSFSSIIASAAGGASGGGATGGDTDKVFYLNDQVVTNSYSIPDGQNAISAGSLTIGVPSVTIATIDGTASVISVVTATDHGLKAGDNVKISNTANYDGTYEVANISSDTAYSIADISHNFVAEASGSSTKEVIVTIPDGSTWVIG